MKQILTLRRAEQAFFSHVERNSRNTSASVGTRSSLEPGTNPLVSGNSPKVANRKPLFGKQISENSALNKVVGSSKPSFGKQISENNTATSGYCIKDKDQGKRNAKIGQTSEATEMGKIVEET